MPTPESPMRSSCTGVSHCGPGRVDRRTDLDEEVVMRRHGGWSKVYEYDADTHVQPTAPSLDQSPFFTYATRSQSSGVNSASSERGSIFHSKFGHIRSSYRVFTYFLEEFNSIQRQLIIFPSVEGDQSKGLKTPSVVVHVYPKRRVIHQLSSDTGYNGGLSPSESVVRTANGSLDQWMAIAPSEDYEALDAYQ